MIWMCTHARRQFFPATIEIEDRNDAARYLTNLVSDNAKVNATVFSDLLTDQINVYRVATKSAKLELLAVYMAA